MAYLSIKGLSKTIDNTLLLDNITFSVEKGTLTLIAGPNGSGKSLLLKCIKGLERPSSGSITGDGIELKKEKDRMKFFGLVFQDTSFRLSAPQSRKI